MYVIAIHEVSDPDAFWSGKLDLPDGNRAAHRCAER